MEKIKNSRPLRITAVFLAAVCVFLSVVLSVGVYIMAKDGFYTMRPEPLKEAHLREHVMNYARTVAYHYQDLENKEYISRNCPNVWFEVRDKDGKLLLSNYNGEKYRFTESYDYTYYMDVHTPVPDGYEAYGESTQYPVYNKYGEIEYYVTQVGKTVNVTVYVKETLEEFDMFALTDQLFDTVYSLRFAAVAACIVSAVLFVILFIFLMVSAGHRKGGDIVLNFFDRIPFDLVTAVTAFIAIEEIILLDAISYNDTVFFLVTAAALIFIDALIALVWFVSFAARCKCGTLIKGTLIYIVFRCVWRVVKKLWGYVTEIFFGIPHVWRCALCLLAVSFIDILICAAAAESYDEMWSLYLLVFLALIAAFILYSAIMMKRLKKGGEEISGGNLSYKIDTSKMPRDFRLHGENLNRIGDGLSLAVEDKIKSERLKTELITNVSHDIKTPLTSIINYVDLIKKEDTDNEKIKEYVGVLDRQSSRLKKLIDDLLEASKASTGNITVNPEILEAGVLLGQAVGEYEERAAASSLDLILIKPPSPVYIKADGRLIWRIIDNLMSNICKYAQAGTRVYLSLEEAGGRAILTFKNISKYPLNISEDELMERFVRGDASRNTEGSGLGLSIAESLAKLQGGELKLSVDGDLFKAILSFPVLGTDF